MQIVIFLFTLAIAVTTGTLGAKAASVPESVTGIWGLTDAEGRCEADGRILLVNSAAVIVFERRGSETSVVFGPAEWAAGALILAREAGDVILPPLDELTSCDRLPEEYYAIFGEAIAFFQGFDAIRRRCDRSSGGACANAIFAFLDVSGDSRLSRAEIARALRAAAFFVGYEAIVAQRKESEPDAGLWDTYRVSVGGIYGASALASLLGPFFTDNLVQSYDFDADGVLSLAEILQDREADSLVGAGGVVGSAAIQTALQGVFRLLQPLLGAATNLFGAK